MAMVEMRAASTHAFQIMGMSALLSGWKLLNLKVLVLCLGFLIWHKDLATTHPSIPFQNNLDLKHCCDFIKKHELQKKVHVSHSSTTTQHAEQSDVMGLSSSYHCMQLKTSPCGLTY
eukprot:6462048-Amphidinium_carterae.1